MERPDLRDGMMFSSEKVFRAALRAHAIQNGTDSVLLKNGDNRVTVKCKNERFSENTNASQIKSLTKNPCKCHRQYKVTHANSGIVALAPKPTIIVIDQVKYLISLTYPIQFSCIYTCVHEDAVGLKWHFGP